ncbi:MAG: hypothetical protein R6V16_00510 [Bacteroidales bacterium]
MRESDLRKRLNKYLSKWFTVTEEVTSDDRKSRIDLIITHNTDISHAYPIGIEIKLAEKKRGKDLANWLKQAIRYTKCKFGKFGKVMVVTAPQITGMYMDEGDKVSKHPYMRDNGGCHNNVNTFLGGFNIGELQKYNYIARGTQWDKNKTGTYYRIVFKGSKIWDSVDDTFRSDNMERLWRAK